MYIIAANTAVPVVRYSGTVFYQKYDDIFIYGDNDIDQCPRAGTISFNIFDMDHGLVSAILNDYFNLAVRNECFCAHPYVKELILDDKSFLSIIFPEKPTIQLKLSSVVRPILIDIMHP